MVFDMKGKGQNMPMQFTQKSVWIIDLESLNFLPYLIIVMSYGNILTTRFI